MPNKKALITGVTGQIGSYLAESLKDKGYEVTGLIRRTSTEEARNRIAHIPDMKVEYGDLGDTASLDRIVREFEPDEIYNLGAQSHVWISSKVREYTADVDGLGVLRICEAARQMKKPIRIYQASTSELFGGIYKNPVDETAPFHPMSTYAVAKLFAFWTIKNYREAEHMFCSNGIVFNTESPRRGENFVTRKITKGIADIMKGRLDKIRLGNLNPKRDWIHAKDTVRAIWSILQVPKPDDYVISSGQTHSIREFAETAFRYAGVNLGWRGEGLSEEGYNKENGKTLISVDPIFFRPADVDVLIGDSSKAKRELGWAPTISFDELVKEMVENDLRSN